MKKKKRTPKRTRRQFAAKLINSLMIVFDAAYLRHMAGESEAALILEHDIIAANSGNADAIAECHRKAIRSAVAAVEEGVSFSHARSFMIKRLNERAEELITETGEA